MTAPLRVLHLGFEDPAMPGAGGGSLRTHEINRRLVAEHTSWGATSSLALGSPSPTSRSIPCGRCCKHPAA